MKQSASILFVEDDPILLPMYIERLKEEGFKIDGIATGEDGKERLEKNSYDLVLLDVMLPGMSGLDLLQWIRQQPWGKELPVVMLSALETDEDKTRGRELGATAYIAKAESTPKTVVEKLQQILAGQA